MGLGLVGLSQVSYSTIVAAMNSLTVDGLLTSGFAILQLMCALLCCLIVYASAQEVSRRERTDKDRADLPD